jgi:hypothetical protein
MWFLLIIAGVLLELIIIIGFVYFFLTHFSTKSEYIPKVVKKKYVYPSHIYSTLHRDELVKSDGDLIPYNLTEKDKEILRMFYEK